MQQFTSIIFDLGGVILNIDFSKTSSAFKKAGVADIDQMYSQESANELFRNLEVGKITEDQFCEAIRNVSGTKLANKSIVDAWNALLLDFRVETINYIKLLRTKYKLFLLSNTNSIHYREFYKIYEKTMETESFDALFQKTYYSHLIGYRKPDVSAFQYVLEDNSLSAEECLFIDDTIHNIEGAKRAGLNTIFLNPEMRVEELGL